MPEIILELKQASAGYEKKIVLKDVTFSLPKGSFCLIRGANGAGKTTLAKVLLKLIPCLHGELYTAFKRPGYISQKTIIDLQYPLTLYDLVAMGEKTGLFLGSKKHEKKVLDSLGMVGLSGKRDSLLGEVSGGQLQRALIARAFLSSPDILILDEPFCNLDRIGQRDIVNLLEEKNKNESLTICFIDHHSIDLDHLFSHVIELSQQEVSLKAKVE